MNSSTDFENLFPDRRPRDGGGRNDAGRGQSRISYSARAGGSSSKASEAYAQLADAVKPLGLTALLREADGRQEILLVKELSRPGGNNPRVNLLLFILTLGSVIFTAAVNSVPASAVPCETPADLAGSLAYQWRLIVVVTQQAFGNLAAGLPVRLEFSGRPRNARIRALPGGP